MADTRNSEGWLQREFPSAAEFLDGKSRRTMLKLMAASFGLAGLAACSRPEQHLAPQARGEMDYVPGNAYDYTSAFVLSGHPTGLVVRTYDGRPTKIEGNPDHPESMGAAMALAQASVLDVYDPDRSKTFIVDGAEANWEAGRAGSGGRWTWAMAPGSVPERDDAFADGEGAAGRAAAAAAERQLDRV